MDNTVQHCRFSEHRVGPHERLDSWKRGNEQGAFMRRKLCRSRSIARFTHAGEFGVHAGHLATPIAHRQAHDTHCADRAPYLGSTKVQQKSPSGYSRKTAQDAVTFCRSFLFLRGSETI